MPDVEEQIGQLHAMFGKDIEGRPDLAASAPAQHVQDIVDELREWAVPPDSAAHLAQTTTFTHAAPNGFPSPSCKLPQFSQ